MDVDACRRMCGRKSVNINVMPIWSDDGQTCYVIDIEQDAFFTKTRKPKTKMFTAHAEPAAELISRMMSSCQLQNMATT